MFKIITFTVFLLLIIALFVGINMLVLKLNYPIEKRYLHFRLILDSFIIGLVFTNEAIGSSLIHLIGDFLNHPMVNSIVSMFIPLRAIELLFILLCTIVANILYALVHLIFLAINKRIYKGHNDYQVFDSFVGLEKLKYLPWFLVNKFYEEKNGHVQLKAKSYTLGTYVKWMKYVSVLVWAAELIVIYISVAFGIDWWNSIVLDIVRRFYLLPMVAFFLFEQIQLFLEGPVGENRGQISSTDISEEMIGDIEMLVPYYYETFKYSKALLCSEIGPKQKDSSYSDDINEVSNSQKEECKESEEKVLEIIFNQLKQSGMNMNQSYQNALIKLINGKSVFVKDNVVGEFTPYYCALLNFYITTGCKVVILCTDDTTIDKVNQDITRYSQMAYGNNMLWEISTVENLNEKDDKANVIILTYHDYITLDTKIRYKDLAEEINYAVFPDCVGLFEENDIIIKLISSKLRSFDNCKQFIFISNVENVYIRNKLKTMISDDVDLSFYENDYREAHTSAMVWKREKYYELQKALNIGTNQSPCLGASIPLAVAALNKDFPKVFIVKSSLMGDKCFLDTSLSANAEDIRNYMECRTDVSSRIVSIESEAISQQDLKIICVYDDDYNFFNALWRWFKYGGTKGSIVHVISPFYMLREYFADNYKTLLSKHGEYMALIDGQAMLDHIQKKTLIAMLSDSDVCIGDIWEYAKQHDWKYISISEMLTDALKSVLPPNEVHSFYNHFEYIDTYDYDKTKELLKKIRTVRLTDRRVIDALKNKVTPASLSTGSNNTHCLNVLKDNIYNYCLEGQVIAYCGEYYVVRQIVDGVVTADPWTPSKIFDYFYISDFTVFDSRPIGGFVGKHQLEFNLLQATVERTIYGYVASVYGNDFSSNADCLDPRHLPEQRIVKFNEVPVLEIRIKKSLFKCRPEDSVRLLSVLLNGLFKTLYPSSHQNIFAVADLPFDHQLCKKILFDKEWDKGRGEELAKITIPGIRCTDRKPDNDYVRLYIIEHSCIEYGMINSFYNSIDNILDIVYDYLNWYVSSGKGTFIHFGNERVPDYFALEELLDMLKNIMSTNEPPLLGNDDNVDIGIKRSSEMPECTFCGRKTSFAWRFADGRVMCGYCHDHMLTQEGEITHILAETRETMINLYHLKKFEEVNVRFQSRDAIEREFGKISSGRVLGFYNRRDKKLWIERKGPSAAMKSTMAHELTHVWQFKELDIDLLEEALGQYSEQKMRLLTEGHAVCVQIDYLRNIGESRFADRLERGYVKRDDSGDYRIVRNDAYGIGYERFLQYYKKQKDERSPTLTPFEVMTLLVKEIIEGEQPIIWPDNIENL